ncbi:peptide/nickel transport system substrate-binding protein [Actinacidiphila yanglinensis]|uniref:non-specific serine/threonine protein kinase n=1 Tax=Actinacidiphila yanglinensis TaxID=310779 RepID=A0A1H5U184_9ACTN|nr:ABC transporter substrate-binding protein [Actinacidiphila yanglinensis]SEF68864.1 peptide/nickel transport system substrate-binding protein [Actinacidiphila yanglinensis]
MSDGLFAGRYELAELLGSGGMARVHRARDTRMGRIVAIKTLMPELALDPDARRRFAREAHAAGSLNHPGIVTVHDQDEYRDGDTVVPYLVMEYVQGGTLAQLVREQAPFTPERAVRIVCDVLDALAHAHAHGTVHRDVKPANVMVTTGGAVKVADFGIARVLDVDTRLTTAGSSIGTPSYMSPEQVNGGDVDARSDVYAVGCVLTELLTGKPPFHDGNPLSVMYWHVHSEPPAPSAANPRVPAELDALVLAALAKDPAGRPADAGIYRARLWAWLTAARATTVTGPATLPPQDFGLAPPGTPQDSPSTPAKPATPSSPLATPPGHPGADPRATFGVGAALPAIPPQDTPPSPAPGPYQGLPGAPQTPQPPGAPASGFGEHPAYSRSPQVPLPPPYQPSTPPPVNAGAGAVPHQQPAMHGGMPPGPHAGMAPVPHSAGMPGPTPGWSARRKILTGVAALAFAGITVSVVLATGAFGDKPGPKPSPDPPTPTPTSGQAALKRHGGTAGTGYNGGVDGVVRPSVQTGGTVDLAASYIDSSLLDPADTYDPSAWNVQRLLYRNLVGYAPAPGDKGRKLLPDLATTTGDVGDNGLTWTYHLKDGIRFQDGSPITSKDIKYGVERTFDRGVHGGGPTYLSDLLDEGQHYPGPYDDSDPDKMGLKSVATPNDSTIVFTLAKPYADFPYILAMSVGAAVPPAADTGNGKDYEKAPVASGPYKVSSYQPGKSLHLVRNPEWDATTDPIRSQLPVGYDLKLYDSQDEVEKALLDGTADLDFSETLLDDQTETQVINSPAEKANTDLAYTGATRYLSLRTDVAPFDNADCRKAVAYAVDRAQVEAALGGQYEGGEVATTMLPPTNISHDADAHLYSSTAGEQEADDARTELDSCGKADGFRTTLVGISSASKGNDAMQAIAASLKQVGIDVTVKTMDATAFYDTLLTPSKLKAAKWGMVYTAWIGDYPTGGGFLRQLVQPGGVSNYANLDDATLNHMVDQADTLTGATAAAKAWTSIDAQLMKDAAMVPLVYDRHLVYRGSRLTNVYQQQVIGQVDLSALGVK